MVHDRTLHDGESYNDAYENSLASIQSYLANYPSIVYVLDLHRDAVQDANGTQYKLVTAEDPAAAQVSLDHGVAHDGWQDNLRLAIAVQEKLESQSPTLMRPITLLNYRYNQFAAPGSLLVEVGAAGNSLDEALRAARAVCQRLRRDHPGAIRKYRLVVFLKKTTDGIYYSSVWRFFLASSAISPNLPVT